MAQLPWTAPATVGSDLEISEFLAFNVNTLLDADGDSSDFIELTNTSTGVVDLAGWSLTDDSTILQKWTFPSVLMQPGQILIVFASKKDRTSPGGELHTNFSLSGDGEYLALIMPNGVTLATEFAGGYPQQFKGTSYGSGLDATGNSIVGYFSSPTPGAPNNRAVPLIAPVVFDVTRGFLDAPVSLGLTCATPEVTIVYTLDGTTPTPTTGTVYVNPITVASTSVVRAQAFFTDGSPSVGASITHTYLFAAQVLTQTDASAVAAGFPSAWVDSTGADWANQERPGASYGFDSAVLGLYATSDLVDSLQAIPSVSLTMPMDDWFGFDVGNEQFGIYVNPTSRGKSWSRACSAEYIDPVSGDNFGINCGAKIQGGSGGNAQVRSQLSIELRFDGTFGPANLKHDLFEGSPIKNFDRLILDAGNQNSIHSPHESTAPNTYHKRYAQGLRDQFMMDLHRSLGGTTGYGRHVHVYINGLYWGLYNLHERPDQHWSSELLGGSNDEHDEVRDGVLKDGNTNPASHPVAPGAWALADAVLKSGLGIDTNYDAFAKLIDLRDYARYLLLNMWAGNREFPTKDWYATSHSRLGPGWTNINPNLSFRFHSWDSESVLWWGAAVTAVGGKYDRTGASGSVPGNSAYFLTALKANPEFPLLFADEAHQHLFNGGALWVDPAFNQEGVLFDPNFPERNPAASIYHGLASGIESAVVMEYARWGNYFHTPGEYTPTDWALERDRLLSVYFPVRGDVVLAQLQNAGLYPTLDAPVFSQHGGMVSRGFKLGMTQSSGASIYYTLDGTDPRLRGGGIAGALYTGGVSLASYSSCVKARSFDGVEWSAANQAVFTKEFGLSINEVMANNSSTVADEAGEFDDWFELRNSSSSDIDLSGFHLTDSASNPKQWGIPEGTVIAAGAYLVFWADKDEEQGALHTNFKLNASGDSVLLFGSDVAGNPLLATAKFAAQAKDESHGLVSAEGAIHERLAYPTPASRNGPRTDVKDFGE